MSIQDLKEIKSFGDGLTKAIDTMKEKGIGMYERFTDRARKVMQLANQEAQRFNREYIHVEHILIGMVREGANIGVQALRKCVNQSAGMIHVSIDSLIDRLRLETEKIKPSGPSMITMGYLPHTPKVKEILNSANDLSMLRNSVKSSIGEPWYVCSEHILYAIVTDKDLETCAVLRAIGINPDDVRDEILRLMGKGEKIDFDAAFDAAVELARMPKKREGESKHPIRDANEWIAKMEAEHGKELPEKVPHDGIYPTLDDVSDEMTEAEAMAYRDGAFRMCALNHAVTLATHCKLEGSVLDAAKVFYNFLSGKTEEGKE